MAIGELSLDGSLNPVAGKLPAAIRAGMLELGLICPGCQGGEAAWASSVEVLAPPLKSLRSPQTSQHRMWLCRFACVLKRERLL